MPIPPFEQSGNLPPGRYKSTIDEVVRRFGSGSGEREAATPQLEAIYETARSTGYLLYFLVFGSYVTAKRAPRDVDIILVMTDNFR